jgi:hypothetical protein
MLFPRLAGPMPMIDQVKHRPFLLDELRAAG